MGGRGSLWNWNLRCLDALGAPTPHIDRLREAHPLHHPFNPAISQAFGKALKAATAEIESLKAEVAEGKLVSGFGAQADAICNTVRSHTRTTREAIM